MRPMAEEQRAFQRSRPSPVLARRALRNMNWYRLSTSLIDAIYASLGQALDRIQFLPQIQRRP